MDQILKELPAESKIYPNAEQFTDLQRLSLEKGPPYGNAAPAISMHTTTDVADGAKQTMPRVATGLAMFESGVLARSGSFISPL